VKYIHSNALNPVIFNSLRVIENEVVRMCASLFHGDENTVGNMTSCGIELTPGHEDVQRLQKLWSCDYVQY